MDCKRYLVLILLALTVVLSVAVIESAYSTTATNPGGTIIEVDQGDVFLLRGSITFDQAATGYFIWGPVGWYHYGDPTENFSLENTPSVYWMDGTPVENVSISEQETPNGHQINIMDNGDGIARNGTFYIDIWLRAASGDGTPHRPMDNHPIYYAMDTIHLWEPDPVSITAKPVTIRVCELSAIIYPSDDADVYERYPDNNYGSDTSIWVSPYDSRKNRGFLKFSLSEIPSNATIQQAKLHLNCWKKEYDDFDAACCEVENDSWSENTVTWNNQPSYGSSLGIVEINGIGWYTWDVENFVSQEFGGDNTVSFCLKGAVEPHGGRALFDSKEWDDNHPYLEIVYTYSKAQSDNSSSHDTNDNQTSADAPGQFFPVKKADNSPIPHKTLQPKFDCIEELVEAQRRGIIWFEDNDEIIFKNDDDFYPGLEVYVDTDPEKLLPFLEWQENYRAVRENKIENVESITAPTTTEGPEYRYAYMITENDEGVVYDWRGHQGKVKIPAHINLRPEIYFNFYNTHMGEQLGDFFESGVGWENWGGIGVKLILYTYQTFESPSWHKLVIPEGNSRNIQLWIEAYKEGGVKKGRMYAYDTWSGYFLHDIINISYLNHRVDQTQEQCGVPGNIIWCNTPWVRNFNHSLKDLNNDWVIWRDDIDTRWYEEEPMLEDHWQSTSFEMDTKCQFEHTMSLNTLYSTEVKVDLYLEAGSKLWLKFYDYFGSHEANYLLWSGPTPDWVYKFENATHYDAVEQVKLVLTDSGNNVISEMASFIVHQCHLRNRCVEILLAWFAHPELHDEFRAEMMGIMLQWFSAPSEEVC